MALSCAKAYAGSLIVARCTTDSEEPGPWQLINIGRYWKSFRTRFLRVVINPESACQAKRNWRSEEHTSELQSRGHLVCRLLLEKKKNKNKNKNKKINTNH